MLNGIKSKFFIRMFFTYIRQSIYLKIINHNKNLQRILNITINDFIKYYNQIVIEITPDLNNEEIYKSNFFNPHGDLSLYEIYFDNNIKINRNYLKKGDKLKKIKIIIEPEVKDIYSLFEKTNGLLDINFVKFNRKDITNMKRIFLDCKSLIHLDISKLITDNATNMTGMFCGCHNLKNLDLSNFKTDNVTDMRIMFHGCSSLKELNVNNLVTDNVQFMSYMFCECVLLKKLDLSNFKTNNVTAMDGMFGDCVSLEELDLSKIDALI